MYAYIRKILIHINLNILNVNSFEKLNNYGVYCQQLQHMRKNKNNKILA